MKTRKRVLLTLALAAVTLFAMTIMSAAGTGVSNLRQTEASTTSLRIEWDPDLGTNGGGGYNVYMSLNGVDGWTRMHPDRDYDTSGTHYNVYSLTAGGTYYFSVCPVYKLGSYPNTVYTEGPRTAALAAVTTPDGVDGLTQTNATTKNVTLSWDAVYGATSYNIYHSDVLVASSTATSATVKASAGTKDDYKVTAVKTMGSFSTEGSNAKIWAKAAPNKPINVADCDAGKLDWDPKTNTCKVYFNKNTKDKYDPEGYALEIWSVDGKKKLKTYEAKSIYYSPYGEFTLKAVKNKGFRVRVRGYIKIGTKKCYGAWSSKEIVIPQANLSVNSLSSTSVKLSWKKVTGATKYVIYAAKNQSSSSYSAPSDAAFKKIKTVNSKTTSLVINKLKKGKVNYFYVLPIVKVGKKTYEGNYCYCQRIKMY